ncbi:lysylphosphatidylglycerol synthase domain-containing protein [Methylobacterium sp. 77]|uniref:lysylphosphatidylglycerol synthase domain-containing protein n=1 Tax=Methylobacterium sp. 77 TaxID=1101192 RepID=UPI00037CBC91|nr:lysylphosphatidylglycerol synthase domain-containing protein [Methylobacterium sp. 77]
MGIGRSILRYLPVLGTVLGLVLAIWLVATHDLASVADAFGRIGILGLGGIVLMRIVVLTLCGVAWERVLHRLSSTAEAGAFLILRFVRDGINVLLPVASVGGDVVGGRLLTFWGVPGKLAAASILVDMLIQVSTQAVFVLIGVALLMQMEGESAASLAAWALRALGVTAALLAAFFVFQRSPLILGVERRIAELGRRFLRDEEDAAPDPAQATSGSAQAAFGSAQATCASTTVSGAADAGVHGALDTVWAPRRWPLLFQGFVLHLLAWMLGAVEIWIALTCMGVEGLGPTEVIVIEALSQAIKSAAFPVPSGLGVQEGGFVLVGGLFGIDPGTAIALSLAKRVPDVVLGLPSLMLWQTLEARRATVIAPRV